MTEPIPIDPEPVVPIIIYDPTDTMLNIRLTYPDYVNAMLRLQLTAYMTSQPVSYSPSDPNPQRLILPVVTVVDPASTPVTALQPRVEDTFAVETHEAGAPPNSPFQWFLVSTIFHPGPAFGVHYRHRVVPGTIPAPPANAPKRLDRRHFDHGRMRTIQITLPGTGTTVSFAWRKKLRPNGNGDPNGPDLLLQSPA
jgi:hypothetical protein